MEHRKLWKYGMRPGMNEVSMPADAELLTVASQHNEPVIWALVEPRNRQVIHKIELVPTGMAPDDGFRMYIGTVLLDNDTIVFHVFDHGEK